MHNGSSLDKQLNALVENILGEEYHKYVVAPNLNENAEPVGREFQHIEDIVYIYGSSGAKRAIERLSAISDDSSKLEVKWDMSPAMIFGRDETGKFHFGDKYSKQLVTNSQAVYDQYINRKTIKVDDSRRQFAGEMSALFDLYEAATPKNFRGFIEAGLMYKIQPSIVDGEFTFKPNTVTYHVSTDSELGKRIGESTSGAVATAYFDQLPALGGRRTPVGNHAASLGNNQVLIVQPKFSTVQVRLEPGIIDRLEQFIASKSNAIESFVNPSQQWISTYGNETTASNKWRDIIYKYVNSQVDVQNGLDTLGDNFEEWIQGSSTLNNNRRQIALDMVSKNVAGLKATFGLVRAIMRTKNAIIDQIEEATLESIGIRAYINSVSGGEGFVDDSNNGTQPLKFVKRGQFTAANRAKNKLKESSENSEKTAVLSWGRGMGHRGHMYLASSVFTTAKELGADAFVFLSKTVGKDDPLEPNAKLQIYKIVFPEQADAFRLATNDMPDLSSILRNINANGYTKVVVIVGEDQKASFQYLSQRNGKGGYKFNDIKVISRQETNDPYAKIAGPRATPMREILMSDSATVEQKFEYWRKTMPKQLTDAQVMSVMKRAAKNMGKPILGNTMKIQEVIEYKITEGEISGNIGLEDNISDIKLTTAIHILDSAITHSGIVKNKIKQLSERSK